MALSARVSCGILPDNPVGLVLYAGFAKSPCGYRIIVRWSDAGGIVDFCAPASRLIEVGPLVVGRGPSRADGRCFDRRRGRSRAWMTVFPSPPGGPYLRAVSCRSRATARSWLSVRSRRFPSASPSGQAALRRLSRSIARSECPRAVRPPGRIPCVSACRRRRRHSRCHSARPARESSNFPLRPSWS